MSTNTTVEVSASAVMPARLATVARLNAGLPAGGFSAADLAAGPGFD
ncbi:hypothetical protein [Kutzneria sp. NPDC052558]